MHQHRVWIVIASSLLALLAPILALAQPDQRCFPATGQCISGRIREFWEQNGGVAVFGYPIAPQRDEVVENKSFLTQWFERSRLELHPDNSRPYDVLLGHLSAASLLKQGRNWRTFTAANPEAPHYFAETGHAIAPQFWQYWSSHGLEFDGYLGTSFQESLALFGMPLSQAQAETIEGQTYTVQWFERARFELHPGNRPPFTVLLGLLGSEMLGIAPVQAPLAAGDAVLVGAGDIASCDSDGDEATAALLDTIDGTVFTVGDNAYNAGTAAEFARCYEPSWGRHKARTRPSPGNHDYGTRGAAGYFTYFGTAAGDSAKGYYSYDLGAWHIIVVNTNCWAIGGCQAGSPQEQWLRTDLEAHPRTCTLAYWHHPRFSSGAVHGSNIALQPIWQALYNANADLVISGHDHVYERFAPQDPSGKADPQRGMRQFVVGTGGNKLYGFGKPVANSEVRNATTLGVLQVTLHATSYDWAFIPVPGKMFSDSGSANCHE
jgi:hypothetical protein